jgi:hypothetical protein
VADRLRYEHPALKARWLSHEAIYTWIYALPKGELARQGILLRSGGGPTAGLAAEPVRGEPGSWA